MSDPDLQIRNFREFVSKVKGGPSTGEIPVRARRTDSAHWVFNFLLLIPRLLWNGFVGVTAISLQVAWLVFLFGSVLGVVLLLLFFPGAFLLPLQLLRFSVPLWE